MTAKMGLVPVWHSIFVTGPWISGTGGVFYPTPGSTTGGGTVKISTLAQAPPFGPIAGKALSFDTGKISMVRNVIDSMGQVPVVLKVIEMAGQTEYTLASLQVQQPGTYDLNFTPTRSAGKFRVFIPTSGATTAIRIRELVFTWTSYEVVPSMWKRCMADDQYRFGFDGMHKENEISGIGNNLDFGARMYDARIGRWKSVDPLASKYPSMSTYSAFGNSPLIVLDPNGKELVVGGNTSSALRDLQSLIPRDYAGLVTLVPNSNNVKFDINQIPEKHRKLVGVTLLSNLINSKKSYLYTVSDISVVRTHFKTPLTPEEEFGMPWAYLFKNLNKNGSPSSDAIDNWSLTDYTPTVKSDGYLPFWGFDGQVNIVDGDFETGQAYRIDNQGAMRVSVNRGAVVFHELQENYFRTETLQNRLTGYSYAPNGGMYYSSEYAHPASKMDMPGGAHEASSKLGIRFIRELNKADGGSRSTAGQGGVMIDGTFYKK